MLASPLLIPIVTSATMWRARFLARGHASGGLRQDRVLDHMCDLWHSTSRLLPKQRPSAPLIPMAQAADVERILADADAAMALRRSPAYLTQRDRIAGRDRQRCMIRDACIPLALRAAAGTGPALSVFGGVRYARWHLYSRLHSRFRSGVGYVLALQWLLAGNRPVPSILARNRAIPSWR